MSPRSPDLFRDQSEEVAYWKAQAEAEHKLNDEADDLLRRDRQVGLDLLVIIAGLALLNIVFGSNRDFIVVVDGLFLAFGVVTPLAAWVFMRRRNRES
jgi:hypothetical protein